MMLSDVDIEKAMMHGEIMIDPYDKSALGPCSIDLTLDDVFRVYHSGGIVDAERKGRLDTQTEIVQTKGEPFVVEPGQFILGQTREQIRISDEYAALLEGRSSIARLGIIVHAAGLVNPGTGISKPTKLTLEIFCENRSPVMLYPGMRIIQIMFMKLSSPAKRVYDLRPTSKYIGQNQPDIK